MFPKLTFSPNENEHIEFLFYPNNRNEAASHGEYERCIK